MTGGGRTRGLRRRLVLAVVGLVLVGVAVLAVAFNLVLRAQLDGDVNDVLHARAAAQLGALSVTGGRLAVGEAPDAGAVDSEVWVFAGNRVLEHPRGTSAAVDAGAAALAAGAGRTIDVRSPATRLLAEPVRGSGRRLGTVVVAESLAVTRRTERTALIASLVLAAALVAAAAFVARWLLGAALRPVARMTAEAAEWSERDLDRRFSLGPPTDELTLLAATLDGLLDRLAAGMRRERRLSAELSHELRTPLAKVSTQAQLMASAPDLPQSLREEAEGMVRSAGQMREVIEVLMSAARAEADGQGASADVAESARAVLAAAGPAAAERGVELDLQSDGEMRTPAEPKLVERILAPLVENAGRHARTRAAVTITREGAGIEVLVEDDGPGVRPEEAGAIFDPGARGSAGAASGHDGAGLGLPLARRLARSAGGDVQAVPSGEGGRFVVRLPPA